MNNAFFIVLQNFPAQIFIENTAFFENYPEITLKTS